MGLSSGEKEELGEQRRREVKKDAGILRVNHLRRDGQLERKLKS